MKFVTLDGAIENLFWAADGLRDLIDEMQDGPRPPTESGKAKEVPTFQIVYDEAATRIMEITERLRKMTGEIRSRLF